MIVQIALFVRSYGPGTLRLSNHSNPERFLWFCLQVFRQAGQPQRVVARPQWEISVSIFPKDTTTRCQLGNRTTGQQPFDH